jgi:uncharacterized delta-60 repeat protein
VAVGSVTINRRSQIAAARLNPDGSPDRTFNKTGSVALKVAPFSYGHAVALQPDGKILVGGECAALLGGTSSDDDEYVVARLNADGSPDTTFGNRGMGVQPLLRAERGVRRETGRPHRPQ